MNLCKLELMKIKVSTYLWAEAAFPKKRHCSEPEWSIGAYDRFVLCLLQYFVCGDCGKGDHRRLLRKKCRYSAVLSDRPEGGARGKMSDRVRHYNDFCLYQQCACGRHDLYYRRAFEHCAANDRGAFFSYGIVCQFLCGHYIFRGRHYFCHDRVEKAFGNSSHCMRAAHRVHDDQCFCGPPG